jgi:hypothetical protein
MAFVVQNLVDPQHAVASGDRVDCQCRQTRHRPGKAIHAIARAVYLEKEFDEPRVIGPPRQFGGPLLEVMVEVTPPRDMVVFHVLPARPKHLDRMGHGDL